MIVALTLDNNTLSMLRSKLLSNPDDLTPRSALDDTGPPLLMQALEDDDDDEEEEELEEQEDGSEDDEPGGGAYVDPVDHAAASEISLGANRRQTHSKLTTSTLAAHQQRGSSATAVSCGSAAASSDETMDDTASVPAVSDADGSQQTTASSRAEQMSYLMRELGLDRASARLLYRAERLQEKGQLEQALRYFAQVLATRPDCEEAAVNSRMIREMLAEQAARAGSHMSWHTWQGLSLSL